MNALGIKKIQEYLKKNYIDAYLIKTSDEHGSEYIPSRFKTIKYLSGFSGSAGSLLIMPSRAYLWTDGRYFLQASMQLKESHVVLKKIGIDESLEEFIVKHVRSLAFDFKTMDTSFVLKLKKQSPCLLLIDDDKIINQVWKSRPSLSKKKVFLLPKEKVHTYAAYKCHVTLRTFQSKHKCGVLVSALDDIAYLLNLRGMDIDYNPVFNAFMFLIKDGEKETFNLYIDEQKLTDEIKAYLFNQHVVIKKYEEIYNDVANYPEIIFYYADKTNYKLYSLMKESKNAILFPTINKAIKRKVDVCESKKAHLKDGIAMCKFIYYLKTNVGKKPLNEKSVSDYLTKLREEQGAIDLSFANIVAYQDHGAIVHYCPTKQSAYPIENEGFLLVDSGGQYLYGTTDVTRTIAFAHITPQMKHHFTLVLKAHIALASATFNDKTTDAQLDYICRKPIWDEHLDYNHGTGHGVGHLLNVHEGPQSIRYNKLNPTVMRKGMITSCEPGLYFENQYGIRHENEILCVRKENHLLGFEPLTYVPFDLEAIDVNMLDEKERKWLNDYHQMVYELIHPYLNQQEQAYLRYATREI